jgi:hypothetical protein
MARHSNRVPVFDLENRAIRRISKDEAASLVQEEKAEWRDARDGMKGVQLKGRELDARESKQGIAIERAAALDQRRFASAGRPKK